MTVQIKLLGEPRIEIAGRERALRGKKAWGLLAYLVLGRAQASRRHLAELLFSEADDPIRALRWNLTELRHALDGAHIATDDPTSLSLPPGSYVDALAVRSQGWSVGAEVEDLDRDLLDGFFLPRAPNFEAWLLNERRYIRACAGDVLREATLARLAAGENEGAIGSAVRLVALDPMDESDQALLIRCYAAAGDTGAAAQQFAGFTNLLHEELGVEPGAAVAAAVQAPRSASVRAPDRSRPAVRARLEAGAAAIRVGAFDAGVECLRSAALGAHELGEDDIVAEALVALGGALAHGGRAHHEEAATALHSAVLAAQRAGRAEASASAQMELAWIEFMAARYERAVRWLEAALVDAGDQPAIRCLALWVRGKCSMEVGSYRASLDDLEESAELAAEIADPARRVFCLSSLGRTQLLMRSLNEARDSLDRAIGVATSHGFLWTTALTEAFKAEVEVLDGNVDEGEVLAERALAAARQVGDASFEAFALHALGTVAGARGRHDDAIGYMESARSRLISTPDCEWALLYSLDGLADVTSGLGSATALDWITELETRAGRHGMKELVARSYLFRHRCGDAGALDIARSLAGEVDNPALHTLLRSSSRSLGRVGGGA